MRTAARRQPTLRYISHHTHTTTLNHHARESGGGRTLSCASLLAPAFSSASTTILSPGKTQERNAQ